MFMRMPMSEHSLYAESYDGEVVACETVKVTQTLDLTAPYPVLIAGLGMDFPAPWVRIEVDRLALFWGLDGPTGPRTLLRAVAFGDGRYDGTGGFVGRLEYAWTGVEINCAPAWVRELVARHRGSTDL